MLDPFMSKMVEEFATKLTEELFSLLKEKKEDVLYFIDNGVKTYLKDKGKKFSKTKTLLHRAFPVNLYDVYQPMELSIANKIYRDVIVADSVGIVLDKAKNLIIEGTAGSGKSTLMKHLFLSAIKGGDGIPVFITLRYLNDFEGEFKDYISEQILNENLSPNVRILHKVLKKGKFIFFLDGYDEIKSDQRNRIIESLIGFMDKYYNNSFFLTSRPYSHIEMLPNFINSKILPLSDNAISSFVQRQVSNIELQGKIIDSIISNRNSFVKDFLSNPLLLSLYILAFNNNSTVPDKKYVFYRRVIDTLFAEHDSVSKFGYEREKITGLAQEGLEIILQRFSFLSYFEGKFSFDRDYLIRTLSKVNENISILDFSIDGFISDMKIATSLWVDDSGIISFAHRSIQEYFCAIFINNLSDEEKARVYRILTSKAINNQLNEYFNFFELCLEINKFSYYKYLTLPILEFIIQEADSKDDYDKLKQFFKIFSEDREFRIYEGDISSSKIPKRYEECRLEFSRGKYQSGLARFLFSSIPRFKEHFKDIDRAIYLSIVLRIFVFSNREKYPERINSRSKRDFTYYKIVDDEGNHFPNFIQGCLEDKIIKEKILMFFQLIRDEIITEKEYLSNTDKSNSNLLDFIT